MVRLAPPSVAGVIVYPLLVLLLLLSLDERFRGAWKSAFE